MNWNFDSALYHPDSRNDRTCAYGHNQRLNAWFFMCRNNGDPRLSDRGATGLTVSGIMYDVMVGNA